MTPLGMSSPRIIPYPNLICLWRAYSGAGLNLMIGIASHIFSIDPELMAPTAYVLDLVNRPGASITWSDVFARPSTFTMVSYSHLPT